MLLGLRTHPRLSTGTVPLAPGSRSGAFPLHRLVEASEIGQHIPRRPPAPAPRVASTSRTPHAARIWNSASSVVSGASSAAFCAALRACKDAAMARGSAAFSGQSLVPVAAGLARKPTTDGGGGPRDSSIRFPIANDD